MEHNRIQDILPRSVRLVLNREEVDFNYVQEIKLRAGKPLLLIYRNREIQAGRTRGNPYRVTKDDIREMLDYISNYSLYAYEQEMKQGFITVEGGHRVGMAGQAIMEHGKIKNLKHISSVNVRMSHEVIGCADEIFPYITRQRQLYHTLVISPPRCGKTTLLRDMIRQISDGNSYIRGKSVGVVDERSEIGGCYMGIPQNDLGMRTDVLDGCPKAEGMIMLIRSMGPEVIAVDEIGSMEDVRAIEYAMHCGCKLLASAHGESLDELRKKPVFDRMIEEKRFERYVVLGNRERAGMIERIWDGNGTSIYPEDRVC